MGVFAYTYYNVIKHAIMTCLESGYSFGMIKKKKKKKKGDVMVRYDL